jgi:hypothetical protein
MSVPIMEQICKNENIPYLLPVETRIFKHFAITPNKELIFSQINKTYERWLKDGVPQKELSTSEEYYQKMLSILNKPDVWYKTSTSDLKPSFMRIKFVRNAIKGIIAESILWIKSHIFRKEKEPIRFFKYLEKIRHSILFYHQKMRFSDPRYFDSYNKKEKYVYFPLQVSPEYIVQVAANMWADQQQVVDALAKSIPADWKIYIKEHPGTMKYRVRPKSFYREIRKYPNVKFIPISTNTYDIIKNSQLVVTLASTTGLEALMCGKPIISFTHDIYSVAGLSKTCNNFYSLSKDIYEVMEKFETISDEEKRKRVLCLLASIIRHSFWVDEPNMFAGDKAFESEKEAHEAAGKLANAIKTFLDQKEQAEV